MPEDQPARPDARQFPGRRCIQGNRSPHAAPNPCKADRAQSRTLRRNSGKVTVTHAITATATSAAASQGHDAGFALGAGRFISLSPSPDAIWPAKSLACQRGGKLQLCYGATASRSPQHSFPKILRPEEVRLLHASNQGWQPMASFPLLVGFGFCRRWNRGLPCEPLSLETLAVL